MYPHIEAEVEQEDAFAAQDQGDHPHYDSDHLGSNSDPGPRAASGLLHAWTLTGTKTSKIAPVDSFAPHQAQRERAQQTSLHAGASRHRGGALQAARSGTASVITHNADAIRRRIGGDA